MFDAQIQHYTGFIVNLTFGVRGLYLAGFHPVDGLGHGLSDDTGDGNGAKSD